jgi:hypothetical protein
VTIQCSTLYEIALRFLSLPGKIQLPFTCSGIGHCFCLFHNTIQRQRVSVQCFCFMLREGWRAVFKWKSLAVISEDKWYNIVYFYKELAVARQRAHFDGVALHLYGFLNVKPNCAITSQINQSSFLQWRLNKDISACIWAAVTCRGVMSSASHFGRLLPGIKGTAWYCDHNPWIVVYG